MDVRLTNFEILDAATVGVQRSIQNMHNGAQPRYGAGTANDWQLSIEGALGEKALAKYLGVYWAGKGVIGSPDVGEHDVRTSTHSDGRLIVHQEDNAQRFIWLLTGSHGEYIVRGGILAKDAKQRRWWCDPSGKGRPAYFVPQERLSHIYPKAKGYCLCGEYVEIGGSYGSVLDRASH